MTKTYHYKINLQSWDVDKNQIYTDEAKWWLVTTVLSWWFLYYSDLVLFWLSAILCFMVIKCCDVICNWSGIYFSVYMYMLYLFTIISCTRALGWAKPFDLGTPLTLFSLFWQIIQRFNHKNAILNSSKMMLQLNMHTLQRTIIRQCRTDEASVWGIFFLTWIR